MLFQLSATTVIAECFCNALGAHSRPAVLLEPSGTGEVWAGDVSMKAASEWQTKGVMLSEHRVEMKRLDDFAIGPIDFAKIDAEGSEAQIWLGGKKTPSTAHAILLEYAPNWLEDGAQMLREMADAGFRVNAIGDNGRLWRTNLEKAHSLGQSRGGVYLLLRK